MAQDACMSPDSVPCDNGARQCMFFFGFFLFCETFCLSSGAPWAADFCTNTYYSSGAQAGAINEALPFFVTQLTSNSRQGLTPTGARSSVDAIPFIDASEVWIQNRKKGSQMSVRACKPGHGGA
eukprot:803167-Pelagomonas_calceolata.AAC.4